MITRVPGFQNYDGRCSSSIRFSTRLNITISITRATVTAAIVAAFLQCDENFGKRSKTFAETGTRVLIPGYPGIPTRNTAKTHRHRDHVKVVTHQCWLASCDSSSTSSTSTSTRIGPRGPVVRVTVPVARKFLIKFRCEKTRNFHDS
eukprot:372371-Rhodomonas_salina.1